MLTKLIAEIDIWINSNDKSEKKIREIFLINVFRQLNRGWLMNLNFSDTV